MLQACKLSVFTIISIAMRVNLYTFVIGVLLAMAYVLTYSDAGRAANMPSPALDAAASAIAGKPVSVHCENDTAQWAAMVVATGSKFDPTFVSGFTYFLTPIIYLNPRSCSVVSAPQGKSVYELAYGFATLAHESVHQAGIVNETDTDCIALTLVRPLLLTLGIPASVRVSRLVQVRVRLRTGLLVRRSVWRSYAVSNPLLAQVQAAAVALHESRPANYRERAC